MKYPIHALAKSVPSMTEEEFAALKADISAQGQLEPIILFESAVLDGIHRQRACDELGVPPKTRQYEGSAPAAFVIAMNVRRRHLSVGQQAATAEALVRYYRTRYPSQQNIAGGDLPKVAQDLGLESVPERSGTAPLGVVDLVAKAVGIQAQAVETFATLRKQAPELAQQVRAGEKPLYVADKERKQATVLAARSDPRKKSRDEIAKRAEADLLAAVRLYAKNLKAVVNHRASARKAFIAGVLDKAERTVASHRRFWESL